MRAIATFNAFTEQCDGMDDFCFLFYGKRGRRQDSAHFGARECGEVEREEGSVVKTMLTFLGLRSRPESGFTFDVGSS